MFFHIVAQGQRIVQIRRKVRFVYLAISSTFWGNMRDIFFLFLIGKKKRKNIVLHLHTATFDRHLSGSSYWVKHFVKKMFRDIKAAIVVGETFVNIFNGHISAERVKVVENCARKEKSVCSRAQYTKLGLR